MGGSLSRGTFAAACCLLFNLGCAPEPIPAPCVLRDLGPFSMCVPRDWQLTQGGIDSAAGTFKADTSSVSYDVGLYSDPLSIPPGATEASDTAVVIDGLPGRRVAYTKQYLHFGGLHLPGIRSTSMGMIKMTIVAKSFSKVGLQEAETAFRSIRINR